ncbi:hypothetical protein EZY14_009220 [Kordia sp. TARA_039_SRF]|nr:hypothetical protein EZY14_009220 [Kordia sp. TARA_039_SRF]
MLKAKTVNIPFMKYYAACSSFAGEPTLFEDKIITGKKIHTIRKSYDYWAQRIDSAHKSPDSIYKLSLWSDKPYVSKQYQAQIGDAQNLWYMPINFKKLNDEVLMIDDQEFPLELIAKNDGLSADIFRDWFKSFVDEDIPSIIIGWTPNPYKD